MSYIRKKNKTHPRVIAGFIKGKLVECPPGEIRPMTAKVKKALFDIIGDCSKMDMLDLFTGSGNIAIEAYSRGINSCDLVESDFGKKKTIEKNLMNAGFTGCSLIITDAMSYCRRVHKKYDFIMVDPPFRWQLKEELINIISEKKLLRDEGFLILHLTKKENINHEIGNLICYDIRNYGLNTLMFYRYIRK